MARTVWLCVVAFRLVSAWCPKKLKPIDSEDCPYYTSSLKFCDDPTVEEGDLCAGTREGNAVCGTNAFLNNCQYPDLLSYGLDVYEVKKYGINPFCPKKLKAVEKGACPAELAIGNCDEVALKKGDFCEGDGECGTDRALNNCDDEYVSGADIYVVEQESEACVDSPTWYYKWSPEKDCAWAGKGKKSKCKKKDLLTKTKARDACPLSCGEC